MTSLIDNPAIQRLAENSSIDVDYFDYLQVQNINSIEILNKIFGGVDMSTYYVDSYEPKIEEDVYILYSHEDEEEDLYQVPYMTFKSWWNSLQQF